MMKIKKKKKRKNGEIRFWARHIGQSRSYPFGDTRIYTIYTKAAECPSLKGSEGADIREANMQLLCSAEKA